MLPTLRPYQLKNLGEIRAAFRSHNRVLLTQPCGAGKGTLASFIVHSAVAKGNSVIFLVNRRTLVIDMSEERLDKLGIDHGIIMGSHKRRKPWLNVHVASIDTLYRRESMPKADLLIIDECRFAVSDTWKKVLAKYPQAKVLGLDATPSRTDGQGLGNIFEAMVTGPSVTELISLGYLVPSLVFRGKDPNMSRIGKIGGDFNKKASSEVCCNSTIVGDIVKTWKLRAPDRKTVCFGVDQKHAIEIADKFKMEGVEVATVFDDTKDKERKRIWDDFDNGSLKIISSVGVVGYGWDHRVCKCVIDAAPTASLSRAIQRWGRGARPHGDLDHFILLDHAGNTHRHGCYEDERQWSLNGMALQAKGEADEGMYTCPKCRCQFRRGNRTVCKFCGAPIVVKSREINVVSGELEELQRRQMLLEGVEFGKPVTPEMWNELKPSYSTMERKYKELMQVACVRGYKTNWPKVIFQKLYGKWPEQVFGKQREEVNA